MSGIILTSEGIVICNIEKELFDIGLRADKEAQKLNFFIEKEVKQQQKEKRGLDESQKH